MSYENPMYGELVYQQDEFVLFLSPQQRTPVLPILAVSTFVSLAPVIYQGVPVSLTTNYKLMERHAKVPDCKRTLLKLIIKRRSKVDSLECTLHRDLVVGF